MGADVQCVVLARMRGSIYIVASARKGGQFGARSHGELKRIGAQPLEPPRTSVARAAENLCGPF